MKNPTVLVLVLVASVLASTLAGCGAKETVVFTPAPSPSPGPVAPPAAPPAAKSAYPLATCVVSGEKLGAMGDPVVLTRDGVEIRLCCKGCLKELDANTKKYVDMVRAATK